MSVVDVSLTVPYLGVPRRTQAELTPIIVANLKYHNHRLMSRCAGQECDSADIEHGCAEVAIMLRDVEWS
jgi:hypothetical protein